jgi:hypothetical protein
MEMDSSTRSDLRPFVRWWDIFRGVKGGVAIFKFPTYGPSDITLIVQFWTSIKVSREEDWPQNICFILTVFQRCFFSEKRLYLKTWLTRRHDLVRENNLHVYTKPYISFGLCSHVIRKAMPLPILNSIHFYNRNSLLSLAMSLISNMRCSRGDSTWDFHFIVSTRAEYKLPSHGLVSPLQGHKIPSDAPRKRANYCLLSTFSTLPFPSPMTVKVRSPVSLCPLLPVRPLISLPLHIAPVAGGVGPKPRFLGADCR